MSGIVEYKSRDVNVVFDGNSLVAGQGASSGAFFLPALIGGLSPISGAFAVTNLGVGAQTTRMMNGLDTGSAADVDGAFVAGKLNILFAWEGTNDVELTALTGLQAASDMTDYIAARKAAHPWVVILLTTLPRQKSGQTQPQIVAANAELDSYNAYLLANYVSMGATAVVDVRQIGSPFRFTDYTTASFDAVAPTYYSAAESSGSYTHLRDAGYVVIAGYCAAALNALTYPGDASAANGHGVSGTYQIRAPGGHFKSLKSDIQIRVPGGRFVNSKAAPAVSASDAGYGILVLMRRRG